MENESKRRGGNERWRDEGKEMIRLEEKKQRWQGGIQQWRLVAMSGRQLTDFVQHNKSGSEQGLLQRNAVVEQNEVG